MNENNDRCLWVITVDACDECSGHFAPSKRNHHHRHYPSRPLAYGAATKPLHPCLSLASLGTVSQLWFMSCIFASSVLRQVVFGQPRFRVPSGVQWIATLVMELASLCSTCPVQRHRFLVMMVIKEKYVDPNKLKSLPTNSFF